MIVLLIPYWRINCKVVPLTVLKCNILNYSKNCYAKNMCGWTFIARHRPIASGYKKKYYVGVIWRTKTWLAAGQRAEVEYTYSENNRRHCAIDIDILNSASRILQCWSYYVKILQDINTTPKELKTERDCSHRQLFRSLCTVFGARQYGVTTRDQAPMKKYPRTLILALTQNS